MKHIQELLLETYPAISSVVVFSRKDSQPEWAHHRGSARCQIPVEKWESTEIAELRSAVSDDSDYELRVQDVPRLVKIKLWSKTPRQASARPNHARRLPKRDHHPIASPPKSQPPAPPKTSEPLNDMIVRQQSIIEQQDRQINKLLTSVDRYELMITKLESSISTLNDQLGQLMKPAAPASTIQLQTSIDHVADQLEEMNFQPNPPTRADPATSTQMPHASNPAVPQAPSTETLHVSTPVVDPSTVPQMPPESITPQADMVLPVPDPKMPTGHMFMLNYPPSQSGTKRDPSVTGDRIDEK